MSLAMLDTTILSNFAHAQRPELVEPALDIGAATTPTVLHELRVGEAMVGVPMCDWRWLSILEPTTIEQRLAFELKDQLDAGEAECLAVAVARGYRFLSDDRAARRVAQHHGVVVSGTLGCLSRQSKINLRRFTTPTDFCP